MLFRRILIANRGEIAVRIVRACRAMGIETVAVYSEFDRHALHVRMADQAVPIGGSPATESYLNIPAIMQAAKHVRADAIHPGYGFLAENPELAAACENAGIVFIGPRSSVIRSMGSKIEARKLAQEAGLQVVPSVPEEDFARIGFPLLIKASAGGGGRGMRIVRSAGEFQEAVKTARSEAERAFGDGSLLIEKYVEGARHVEVQIFGDGSHVTHFFERDCSVQRRYQKIIEESPSPAVTPEVREQMGQAAVALARRLGYTNAGTVEFLLPPQHAQNQTPRASGTPVLAPSGQFYFIEVNTRIQVEHPVTEMVTGLDLVRMQIEIAQGQSLPAERPQINGHAIEARLYAEDPTNGFLPSTGRLHVWEPPEGIEGVRVDSGVEEGTEIGVYYDSLLAKIIAHGPDRETAVRKLVYALKHCAAQGVETNREHLIDVLESEEFRAGRAHTGFRPALQKHTEHDDVFAAVAQAYLERSECATRAVLPSVPVGYRNNPYRRQIGSSGHRVPSATQARLEDRLGSSENPGNREQGTGNREEIGHRQQAIGNREEQVKILKVKDQSVEALVDGIKYEFKVKSAAEGGHGPTSAGATQDMESQTLYIRSSLGQKTVVRAPRFPRREGAGERQTANSPMPGQVLRVLVAEGQRVKMGDALIALEAMKMEQTIKATISGVVGAILVKPGEIVAPGQKLVEITSEKSHEHADNTAAASD